MSKINKLNNKALIFSFFFICLVNFSFYSFDGVMAGQKDVRIARTNYFDIIYANASEESANVLYKNADNLYDELAKRFNLKNTFRIPVVVSPSQDVFNAYYSSAPFNHIVIYDTVAPESQNYFTDVLLNTFRHELIHAITYNLHNNFWTVIKDIFGDTYNPALLTITTAWAEGATVSTESDNGEGRLNSDFHKQLIRQAKIEGKFPKYSEIQGSRDSYPNGNLSYYLGGAFNEYLQETYGMEKYSLFWYKCVNFQTLTYFTCFKKVYGFSIQQAWQDFYDSIKIPNIKSNPIEEDWCKPFSKKDFKKTDSQYFDCITSSESSLFFFDRYSSSVKEISLSENSGKIKKLLPQKNVNRLNSSSDGKFLAISYTSLSGRVPKNKINILNVKTKKTYIIKKDGVRDSCVFLIDNNYYLANVCTFSQNSQLEVYKLNLNKNGKIKSENLIYSKKFDFSTEIYSLSADSYGNVYYILKERNRYSIGCNNFLTNEVFDVELPIDVKEIRSINVLPLENKYSLKQDGSNLARISFSYTKKDSMPRFAVCSIDFQNKEAIFSLSDTDSSGGVFNPVFISENEFAFEGHFFEENRIFYANINKIPQSVFLTDIKEKSEDLGKGTSKKIVLEIKEFSEPFSQLKYSIKDSRGTILPFALTSSYAIKNTADKLSSVFLPIGVTYVTSSPWTYPLWGFSAGYNFLTNSWAFMTGIYGGTPETSLFSYTVLGQVEFDSSGYKQFYGKINLSSKKELTKDFYLSFSENFQFFEGSQTLTSIPTGTTNYFGSLKNYDETQRFLQINKTSLGIGNINKKGSGFYDYSGFEINAIYDESYSGRLSSPSRKYYEYQNICVDLIAKTNFLRPITLEAMLFPSKSYFLAGYANLVLFTKDIQKSTNVFPVLYANRFTLSSYYLGKITHKYGYYMDSWSICDSPDYLGYLFDGDFSYYDEVALKASFMLTPNFGGLARSDFRFELSTSIYYRPSPTMDESNFSISICGITVF